MTEPQTEGGAFLAAALQRDVLHPGRGVNAQNDAIDAPEAPNRAVDPTQGMGAPDDALTPEARQKRAFRDLIENNLSGSNGRVWH